MKLLKMKRLGMLTLALLLTLTSMPFTPTAVMAADFGATVFYAENPEIPDFGVFAGAELESRNTNETSVGYIYYSGYDLSALNAFEEAVIAAGYKHLNDVPSSDGTLLIRRYAKDSKMVMLAVAADGRFGVIFSNTSTYLKTYDMFPEIPDFSISAGNILISKEEQGDAQVMVYTYHCNSPEASELMMSYGSLLVQIYGWEPHGIYSAVEPGWYFTKDSMEIILHCPTPADLSDNRTVYIMIVDNAAESSGYWEGQVAAAEAEQSKSMTDDDFNAWLMGQADFSDAQLQEYTRKKAAEAPKADPNQTTFTMTDTLKKRTSSGNVYNAPLGLTSQLVGYINVTNPDKVRYGCTIQITSGKNAVTGLWDSYNIDEDGVPGGTVYTVVDAVVID